MLTPGCDTTIGTLRIRGPAGVQDRVNRTLQQADWPGAGGEEIVFVRKIHVADSVDRIGPALLEQVRHCIHQGGDPANIMRFANRLEMLAALLADMALGVAAQRWYWRRWSRLFSLPPSLALYSVLADDLPQLNGLVEALHARQQLVRVWQSLGDPEAQQLTGELCWKNGYRLLEPAASPGVLGVSLNIPQRIAARWRPALKTIPADSPCFRLAALLIAQESVPLMLLQSSAATLTAITNLLTGGPGPSNATAELDVELQLRRTEPHRPAPPTGQDVSRPPSPPSAAAVPPGTDPAGSPSVANMASGQVYDPQPGVDPGPDEQPVAEQRPGDSRPLPHRIGTASNGEAPPSHPFNRVAVRTERHTEQRPPPLAEFHTEQGGALYLLNFLNRQPLQSIMGDYWETLPSGWIWFYRVAQLLELDPQDPLVPFLATQLGLDDQRALQALPPLPERERIELLAQRWYGESGLWQPSLLRLPARIRYSASHLDLHTTLPHTRLDVRLAGLDLNPGWLPWLGRVVQFHFEQSSEKQRGT